MIPLLQVNIEKYRKIFIKIGKTGHSLTRYDELNKENMRK